MGGGGLGETRKGAESFLDNPHLKEGHFRENNTLLLGYDLSSGHACFDLVSCTSSQHHLWYRLQSLSSHLLCYTASPVYQIDVFPFQSLKTRP